MTIILGIDPGLQKTGFGLIQQIGNQLKPITCGVLKTRPEENLSVRLAFLHLELVKILKAYKPNFVSVEETFVNKNPASALKLGQARGVLLMTPSLFEIPVFEYSANKIKKAIVGSGHASKEQMMIMVKYLLPTLKETLTPDSADALAIAICHAHHFYL